MILTLRQVEFSDPTDQELLLSPATVRGCGTTHLREALLMLESFRGMIRESLRQRGADGGGE